MEWVLAPKDEFISEIVKENGTVFKLKISVSILSLSNFSNIFN